MAFIAFPTDEITARIDGVPAAAPVVAAEAAGEPKFSALEWSVVALAERDDLSSLRAPGRIANALGSLFGASRNPRLADPTLEALRRLAVLTWHHGYQVPMSAVQAFLASGFSIDQYELLAASIGLARAERRPRTNR